MGRFHVYVTDQRQPSFEIERRILEEIGADLTLCNCVTEDDIIRECTDADAVMLGDTKGQLEYYSQGISSAGKDTWDYRRRTYRAGVGKKAQRL